MRRAHRSIAEEIDGVICGTHMARLQQGIYPRQEFPKFQLSDVDGLSSGWLPSGRGCPFENIIGLLTILTIFGLIIVLIVILYFIVLISDQVQSLPLSLNLYKSMLVTYLDACIVFGRLKIKTKQLL